MVINDLAFNQDSSFLTVSTSSYYKIFNCEPFGEFYSSQKDSSRRSLSKSIDKDKEELKKELSFGATEQAASSPTAYARMFFSTSLVIIIPDNGNNSNKLLTIYNSKQNNKICDMNFPSPIVDLRLNRKRFVVFLQSGQIFLYNLACVALLKVLDLAPMGRPVGDLNSSDNSHLVLPLECITEAAGLFSSELIEWTQKSSIPQKKRSNITLRELKKDGHGWVLVYDTMNLRTKLIFKAHDSEVAKIKVCGDSPLIATASVKGTIIRVFSLKEDEHGDLHLSHVTNLRRGHNPARINALNFNGDLTVLGCASGNNTVHLFRLSGTPIYDESESDSETNSRSSSQDLNENLSSLLLTEEDSPPPPLEASSSYFSKFKKTSKLINNQYTQSIMKKIPYRDYLENLIWEPPRRCFAYIKLPEHTSTHEENRVEIGFNGRLILLASYQTGNFYQYSMPQGVSDEEEDREECKMLNQYKLE